MNRAPGTPIRVVTVEDDPRFRRSLELLLSRSSEFTVVGSFDSPLAVLEAAESAAPASAPPAWDLVLMDLELPGMTGIECTRRLREAGARVPVVVLTVFEDRRSIVEAICAGADGYLLKGTPGNELLPQLRAVVEGGAPLSGGVARTVLDVVRQVNRTRPLRPMAVGARVDLTPRESDVLGCLVRGMSYKAAADALGIGIETVRTHIRGVYRKLQVRNVAEAVSRALHDGLV